MSIDAARIARLVLKDEYSVWTATPARSAMAVIVVPGYPRSTKQSIAASSTRCLVWRARCALRGPYDAEIVGPPMVMPTTYAVSG
jgi:hypothetical protein